MFCRLLKMFGLTRVGTIPNETRDSWFHYHNIYKPDNLPFSDWDFLIGEELKRQGCENKEALLLKYAKTKIWGREANYCPSCKTVHWFVPPYLQEIKNVFIFPPHYIQWYKEQKKLAQGNAELCGECANFIWKQYFHHCKLDSDCRAISSSNQCYMGGYVTKSMNATCGNCASHVGGACLVNVCVYPENHPPCSCWEAR